MTKLEDLATNAALRGVLPDALVTVVNVKWFGSSALELTYKDPSGLKFDATPIFPKRIAYTVPYKLSDAEAALYKAVTDYVCEEFKRLESMASAVRRSGEDKKWRELSGLLSEIFTTAATAGRAGEPEAPYGAGDVPRPVPSVHQKLFIFTEHRDTLTITVTRNEILYSLNKPDDFILAIVEFHDDGSHRVHYVRRPFQREPDFGVTSSNYDFKDLLARAEGTA
jgi:hypothetical protein